MSEHCLMQVSAEGWRVLNGLTRNGVERCREPAGRPFPLPLRPHLFRQLAEPVRHNRDLPGGFCQRALYDEEPLAIR